MCALAPATRALQRCLSGRLRLAGAGWARLARSSWWPGKPLQTGAVRVPLLVSELPYPGRRAPRRLQAVHAVFLRCGAYLGVPAAQGCCFGVGAASDGTGRRGACLRRGRLACVHWLPRRARRCAGSRDACAWRGPAGLARLARAGPMAPAPGSLRGAGRSNPCLLARCVSFARAALPPLRTRSSPRVRRAEHAPSANGARGLRAGRLRFARARPPVI